jgi:hypothetical protein
MSSQAPLIDSHISEVSEPRTARAFCRAFSKHLRIETGLASEWTRNSMTFSGVTSL